MSNQALCSSPSISPLIWRRSFSRLSCATFSVRRRVYCPSKNAASEIRTAAIVPTVRMVSLERPVSHTHTSITASTIGSQLIYLTCAKSAFNPVLRQTGRRRRLTPPASSSHAQPIHRPSDTIPYSVRRPMDGLRERRFRSINSLSLSNSRARKRTLAQPRIRAAGAKGAEMLGFWGGEKCSLIAEATVLSSLRGQEEPLALFGCWCLCPPSPRGPQRNPDQQRRPR